MKKIILKNYDSVFNKVQLNFKESNRPASEVIANQDSSVWYYIL